MDEALALDNLQQDSHIQVTWQGHLRRIIGLFVAGSTCKYKQSGILYLHWFTLSPLASMKVVKQFDFCLHSPRPRPSATPLTRTSYAALNRCKGSIKRLVLPRLYSFTTQVCMLDWQLHSLQKIIDSLDKPAGSQAAKTVVQWWIFFFFFFFLRQALWVEFCSRRI